VVFGLSAYYSSDRTANVYSAFIWQTFTVFARVLVVPSTGRRTAVVAGASFVPLVLAASLVGLRYPEHLDLPPLATLLGTLIFAGVAVLLATTGSRVIYGLRQRVREAVRLGQYTLGEKLGEGGMGSVYKATHAMLRRPTAIKLLPVKRFGADSIARFEREVQLTSALSHPNTVAIFDYGRSPDGVFYYAMEYLDGIDLEGLVRTFGPLPSDRVVGIIRQVCGALAEAHALGLIHRDVKPGNILLCQRGGKPDVAKVVDFGLVEQLDPEGPTPELVGTPAYLAPEAITDGSVGPASDLYALGAVAYFLLSGHRVFDGATFVELCVQHTTDRPQPPSERTSNPIPPALEDLVMTCLAKDPAARVASAEALEAELAALEPTGNWSTAHAIEWWSAFDQVRRDSGGAIDPEALTVSIDLAKRAAQAREAGQTR
jgi:serine/threonine-protein kinase